MMRHLPIFPRCCAFLVVLAWCTAGLVGQPQAATGVIEGRVFNPATGEYVERARLTVEGSALETFTDSDGNYRLTNVPAGTARVTVFFTGLAVQAEEVAVRAGETVQRDINFAAAVPSAQAGPTDDTVKLSQFIVGAAREMSGVAIAINEQRFAPNLKNVVSTEEFGNVAEGNVAEFLKFLPGITIDYGGGNARDVSINGVPADNVPVTIDGFSVASAGVGDAPTNRSVSLDMISINNLSRIEVAYSPTPESPGSALAGSVNMVPRSSFERSRPVFNGSVYLMMREYARDFNPTPGPWMTPTRKVHPGFDFSYVMPVNKRFGFTVSAGVSTQYSGEPMTQNTWRGAGSPTNGAAFPHTTPDQPYLSSYLVRDGSKETTRVSFGATADYRLTRNDRLSLGFQYSYYYLFATNHNLTFNVGRVLPGQFTTTSTHGAAGAGDLQLNNLARDRANRTYMPTLSWRHDGPIWKSEAGLGYSQAANHNRDIDKGLFNTTPARRTGVTVSFDDIFYLRPAVITVTDGATGAPIDPYSIATYALTGANTVQNSSFDLQRTAYANLRRDFYGRVPFTVKGGVDLRQSAREIRGGTSGYTFVGADGRASTTPVGSDDSAVPFLNESLSQRVAPFGFPPLQGVSPALVWNYFTAHPGQFTLNENNEYRATVSNSKHAEEVVSSAFLRGDVNFFERRLKLVGGVRAEQTNVKAEGPLTDPTRNFQRNASGQPILGANGRPLPITTDPLASSRLTFIDRGAKAEKEYLRLFPSLNAGFNLRPNLIARAAYYYSVGRPNFNQYAGGLTLPDLEIGPTPVNRIQVNNAGIKAWSAKSANVRLEYYFEGVGQVSVGAFRRDFRNFFGGTVFTATPEFLQLYGLDPALYAGYDVATQHNVEGIVRMEGVDFNYKQSLTFLPPWARGFQVFANGSAQRATGANLGAFTGSNYIPRSGSWGFSLMREKYNVRMNWNYRGRQRRGEVAAGASIEPGTYNWGSKRLYLDVLGEYYFWKRFALFANLRNLGGAPEDFEIAGPSTPAVAQFRQRIDFGSLWTFGVKATF